MTPRFLVIILIRMKKLYIFIVIVFFVSAFAIVGGVFYFIDLYKGLPSPEQFETRRVDQSTKIYDRTGEILLFEVFGDEKRTVVSFEEIPEYLKLAVISAEDANFYNRPGFDMKGIARAFITNLKEGSIVQGGSTITQQLARNTFLTPERTIKRKIRELILALKLESTYSKDEILNLYLNQIPFGSNAYGVEAASQIYFGKSVKEINLAESTILASLIKAPSYFSPWNQERHSELFSRQRYVLNRMADFGYISEEEKNIVFETELDFVPARMGTIRAPHFSIAVRNYLIDKYGEDIVLKGGLEVITTLDWEIQQIAEESIRTGSARNEELFGSNNAAILAQGSKTGDVLAMVGSRDYFNQDINGNFNVVTQGNRQPGSALKPFVYLTAFQRGFLPKTIVYDALTEFDVRNLPNTSYRPVNFDRRFRGPISLEEALAQSINVPAVKTFYLAGVDDVLNNLWNFGISTLRETWRYGLTLPLGGGEIKMVDLVNAYSVLSRDGVFREQRMVLRVTDSEGSILEENGVRSRRVADSNEVRQINRILADPELRAPIFGASLRMTIFEGYDVALKTGTSDDHRDAWTIGYTPSLVVGVWAGNTNNSPMINQPSSILAAVPIWNAFMEKTLPKFDAEFFPRSEPAPSVNKPMLNGEHIFRPIIDGQDYPQIHSILYYVDKKDPLGLPPTNPANDSQFLNWEKGVMEWAEVNIADFHRYNQPLPSFFGFDYNPNTPEVRLEGNMRIFNFTPNSGEFMNSPFIISAEIESMDGIKEVELVVNNRSVNKLNMDRSYYQYFYYYQDELEPQNMMELRVTDSNNRTSFYSSIIYRKD